MKNEEAKRRLILQLRCILTVVLCWRSSPLALQLQETPWLLVHAQAAAASLLLYQYLRCTIALSSVPDALGSLSAVPLETLAPAAEFRSAAGRSLSTYSSVFRRNCSSQTSANLALGEAVTTSAACPSCLHLYDVLFPINFECFSPEGPRLTIQRHEESKMANSDLFKYISTIQNLSRE